METARDLNGINFSSQNPIFRQGKHTSIARASEGLYVNSTLGLTMLLLLSSQYCLCYYYTAAAHQLGALSQY